jgi:hypothetical protein
LAPAKKRCGVQGISDCCKEIEGRRKSPAIQPGFLCWIPP